MFALKAAAAVSKTQLYSELQAQARALLEGERDAIANAANLASLIFHTLPDLNWVGFYRMSGGELVLGPFHGKPACVRIGIGTGVCGTAARDRRTIIVPNVDEFPGHIACDAASRSEVVVPIVHANHVVGAAMRFVTPRAVLATRNRLFEPYRLPMRGCVNKERAHADSIFARSACVSCSRPRIS